MQDLINKHKYELIELKSRIYDAEKVIEQCEGRMKEVGGILATLEYLEKENKEEE